MRAVLQGVGPLGSFGVFVRSDTNVEDLRSFTGAGLNLTVPNRVDFAEIMTSIRAVWASPFTERSFRWRQRLLQNPEHVYPSVLLHKTVPSEMSGVMVTVDLETGSTDNLTVSVSEGVAAVVDGGSPETLIVDRNGVTRLLASSRTPTRKVIPAPPEQGVRVMTARGLDPLLGGAEVGELRALADEVKARLSGENRDNTPWDIEFGFADGRAYLMQLRPLRSSRSPATHPFLVGLDTQGDDQVGLLDLSMALP